MKNTTSVALGLFGLAVLVTAISIRHANKGRCVKYRVGKFKKFTLYETNINC